jgi:hypothetical protein
MDEYEEPMYYPNDGDPFPATEFLDTENIQETGIDWFRQNDVYKRYMGLSYLPNNVSVSALRALVHAKEVKEFCVNLSTVSDDVEADQTSLLAAKMSTLRKMLERSKIYKIARSKIISTQADEITRDIQEPTVDASILFRIEAETKDDLDTNTENIIEKSRQIGAEVTAVEAQPEVVKSAMNPVGIPVNDIGDQFCITIDAATFAALQTPTVPRELIKELFDEDPDQHIYI